MRRYLPESRVISVGTTAVLMLLLAATACDIVGLPPTVTPTSSPRPTPTHTPVPSPTPTAIPTLTVQEFVCGRIGSSAVPDSPVIFPAPESLSIEPVNFYPAFLHFSMRLTWIEDDHQEMTCRRLLLDSGGETVLLDSDFFDTPRNTPFSGCLRMFTGNNFGRSELSEPLCVNIKAPPPGECTIDRSIGQNTVCDIAVERVVTASPSTF